MKLMEVDNRTEYVFDKKQFQMFPSFIILCLSCSKASTTAIVQDHHCRDDYGSVYLICVNCKTRVDLMQSAESIDCLGNYLDKV